MNSTVSKRYFFTVIASLFRALVSFITGLLLARFLGPRDYGNMSFLLGTFLAVKQLLDMGSSQAFFTFMSQKLRSNLFVIYYFIWLFIQFIFTICIIGILLPDKWLALIWHGQDRFLIMLAFAASFMQNTVWTSVQQALEAQRQTYKAQGIGTLVIVVHILSVLLLWWLGSLGLYIIFAAIAFEYFMATLFAQKYFKFADEIDTTEKKVTLKWVFQKFIIFCKPMIIYSWVNFVFSFLDTWLLQNFGGSVKQAFYSISAQFASVALLATSSITNIFYKEIAEAYHNNNLENVKILYRKVSRSLFFIGAVTSCFFIPWSKDLLIIMLGKSYEAGSITLAIMLIYPIHQSMGQIGNLILFATENVSLLVKIGIGFMLISIVVSYFVLAPKDALVPGLNLASEGLAIKMVVMQLLQVNIIAFFIAKLFKWEFDWIFQPLSIICCLIAGLLAHYIAVSILNEVVWTLPYKLTFSAGVYLIFILIIIYFIPMLTGFSRKELFALISKGLKMLKRENT